MTTRNATSTGIGLRHVRVALRSDYGIPTIPAGVAVGAAYGGLQLSGGTRLTLTPAESRRVTAQGDDAAYHTFVLPPNELPTGELVTTKANMEAIALLTTTKMYGSSPVRKLGVATDMLGFEEEVMLWAVRQAIDSEEGSPYFGQQVWQMYCVLNALMSVRPAALELDAVGEVTYQITANYSTLDELGVAFSQATHGFTRAPYIIAVFKDFPWLDVFVGNGTEDTFTLSKSAETLSSVDPIFVSVNGVMQTSGWSEVDGEIVFTAPPVDGARIAVEYSYVS